MVTIVKKVRSRLLAPMPEVPVTGDPPEEPVSLLMAGFSLAVAGMTALSMLPLSAIATFTAVPLLIGAGMTRRM
jgi:hypothetical protein